MFCQGTEGVRNELFSYLPLIPNKGELLTVKSSTLPKLMVSKKVFSFPIGQQHFTIGATYDHIDRSENITKKAQKELMAQLEKITPTNKIKVVNQKYGFRPTTIDRRPLIGEHPIIKKCYIFNGMGSKGVLMTPLLAKEFLDCILNNISFSDSVNINRYSSKNHRYTSSIS